MKRNKDGSARDSQKERLYTAERDAGIDGRRSTVGKRCLIDTETNSSMVGVRDGTLIPVPYPSVAAVQSYVDAIRTSAKFQRRWGYQPLTATHNPSGSRGGNGVIHMGADHRRDEWVILHEIAHNLTTHPGAGPRRDYAAHGPEFAAVFLELVKIVLGAKDAATLRASFTKHRVKYRSGLHAVPKPSEDRLARAREIRVKVTKPPRPEQAVTFEQLAARKAKRKTVAGYDASYLKGWTSRAYSIDGVNDFKARHPAGNGDAWEDGYLDQMAGRDKWHMRECIAGRVECEEHSWSEGWAAKMGIKVEPEVDPVAKPVYPESNGRSSDEQETDRKPMKSVNAVSKIEDPMKRLRAASATLGEIKTAEEDARALRNIATIVAHLDHGVAPVTLYRDKVKISRGMFNRLLQRAPSDEERAAIIAAEPRLADAETATATAAKAAADVKRYKARKWDLLEIRDTAMLLLFEGDQSVGLAPVPNAEISRATGLTSARVAQLRTGVR